MIICPKTPKFSLWSISHAILSLNESVGLAKSIPNSYIPQQFMNPYNTESHNETTAPEIYEQMEGRIDAWVTGAGTGGTFTGVAKYLRERIPKVYCVVVEPQGSILKGGEAGPHEVEGIGASSFIPPVLDLSLADDIIKVDDDPAFAMVRRLAAEEGILGGSSAGANVDAAGWKPKVAGFHLSASDGTGMDAVGPGASTENVARIGMYSPV